VLADAANTSFAWLNLGCSSDCLSFSAQQAKRLMEVIFVVKLKEAEAAAITALSMKALEKQAMEEEGEPPKE
jgi:hypothetical protein